MYRDNFILKAYRCYIYTIRKLYISSFYCNRTSKITARCYNFKPLIFEHMYSLDFFSWKRKPLHKTRIHLFHHIILLCHSSPYWIRNRKYKSTLVAVSGRLTFCVHLAQSFTVFLKILSEALRQREDLFCGIIYTPANVGCVLHLQDDVPCRGPNT
jgi:hypothetical protein